MHPTAAPSSGPHARAQAHAERVRQRGRGQPAYRAYMYTHARTRGSQEPADATRAGSTKIPSTTTIRTWGILSAAWHRRAHAESTKASAARLALGNSMIFTAERAGSKVNVCPARRGRNDHFTDYTNYIVPGPLTSHPRHGAYVRRARRKPLTSHCPVSISFRHLAATRTMLPTVLARFGLLALVVAIEIDTVRAQDAVAPSIQVGARTS